jgi:hypothetical protein
MAKKAELKTRKTAASVAKFIAAIPDDERRADCLAVARMMKKATKAEPVMWGSSIVGFGKLQLKYESGRELDWFPIGFSPRKSALTLYLSIGYERHPELMKKLGKHKTGKSCLYLKRLADVDRDVLRQLIEKSVASAKRLSA